MAQKPSIPKGTRDFSPKEVAKRNYIFSVIKSQFELYGYQPIETPSFENSETLMGKYGEEGDRLIFKILNSGDFLEAIDEHHLIEKNTKKITSKISEKALRYDLTVPFARYVVQHQNELEFPFKRYQMQPVWRADRPQKGRFREFYQCDADVVGSTSLLQEIELIQLYDAVFSKLKLKNVTIKLNNRKILSGIAQIIGAQDKLIDFTVALDKLDKIGVEGVKKELIEKGFSQESLSKMEVLFTLSGSNNDKLEKLTSLLSDNEEGKKGLEEVKFIVNSFHSTPLLTATLEIDITLARGLNYYTGAIFEVVAQDVQMGSIGGGGRYDDLTGIFGLKNMSGVGISFGLDRIYLVLEELKLFPDATIKSCNILFFNTQQLVPEIVFPVLEKLRQKSISCEYYPDEVKIDKQFKYAEKKGISFIIKSINENKFEIKNITTGELNHFTLEEVMSLF